MQVKSFRFNLQELGGALGDLGTLLPLMVALRADVVAVGSIRRIGQASGVYTAKK